jgi:hypothetical protein
VNPQRRERFQPVRDRRGINGDQGGVDADMACDGVEEWLELGSLPFHFDVHPWMRELLVPDRVIGLHATDTGDAGLVDFWLEQVGFG